MLARREDVVAAINATHKNPDYLTEFELPHNLTATTDTAAALKDAAFIIHCVPLQASTEFLLVSLPVLAEERAVAVAGGGKLARALEHLLGILSLPTNALRPP